MSDEAKCSSCGAAIIWIEDQNGTKIPINKTRVRIYYHGTTGVWYYKETGLGGDGGEPLLYHISHFVTCPSVRQHSKQRKEKT